MKFWVATAFLFAAVTTAYCQYSFRTLDVPGDYDTFLYSLNNRGVVVGTRWTRDGSSSVGIIFSNLQFTPYAANGAAYTELDAVNERGDMVGAAFNEDGSEQFAFTLFGGSPVQFSASASTLLTKIGGLNNRCDFAGSYTEDASFVSNHAFASIGGSIVPFEFPGPDVIATFAVGINDRQQIAGWYLHPNGTHGFIKDDERFIIIDYPGARATQARGINNRGAVAGYFQGPSGRLRGFVWFRGSFVTLEVPGARITLPQAINDRGQVAGYYRGDDRFHGFVATPTGSTD